MKLSVWGQTDVGLCREINQDSILVDEKLGLFVVADGMGGHIGGEVASALAVETAREIFENQLKNGTAKDVMVQAYREASARIYHKGAKENPELQGMGTTMVMAFFNEGRVLFGNVGDSRAYLLHGDNLWQLTEDHSLVSEQIRAGIISESQAEQMAGRNVITRSVGYEHDVAVDIIDREYQSGELFLLCSDGLCGLIPDEELADICVNSELEEIVPKCIKAANDAGGDDNISVIVVKVQ